jgi:hypothetical protein
VLVDLQEAQIAFETLPAALRLSTVSPVYCAADARRDTGLVPRFLLFRAGDALLLHSIHESAVPGGGCDWQSPYGYGGPVGVGMTPAMMPAAWGQFDATAGAHGVIAEFVRFHPLADNYNFYPGNVREDRPVVTVDLGATDLASTYTVRARNTLRKAIRAGLAAKWEEPGRYREDFAAHYQEAMRRINIDPFYVFGSEYFAALFALAFVRVLVVRLEAQVVAAGAFLFGPGVAEYHLSATTPEGRALGATNLLLHEAACRAQAEGLTSLYLGGGTDSKADNPLLRFKESFAPARQMFRFGFRVLDPAGYEQLRERFPEAARRSNRVLFYRGG